MNNATDPDVVTRFAPSPSGYLHIGGARTALFNWLFAKANNGKFLLRIEDTDRARSTPEATQALLDGLTWLGLDWDGDAISQFSCQARHQDVAKSMLENGTAYKCFSTPQELDAYRKQSAQDKNPLPFQSPWRDADPSDYPDAPYVIRLKTPRHGQITIKDRVQGQVTWDASTFDDLVLLRSDGTPTYMLAVVVDDYDMAVSHIIRGDDHLINAARQSLIYAAMAWDVPIFAHIPLIHGEDGKKLSKRHGATGIHEYAGHGYMPAAMRNYLTRLGWSHGNDELFSTQQAIKWFNLSGLGKSPARLDFKKLDHVSAYHIKTADPDDLARDLWAYCDAIQHKINDDQKSKIRALLPDLSERAKKLGDILNNAQFILANTPLDYDEKARQTLDSASICILKRLTPILQDARWSSKALLDQVKAFADENSLGLGKIGMPLKAALSGRVTGPSAFLMLAHLGPDESLSRINAAIARFS